MESAHGWVEHNGATGLPERKGFGAQHIASVAESHGGALTIQHEKEPKSD